MNQSEFLEITCNLLKAQVRSRYWGAVGFGFASLLLENWRESNQSSNYFGQSLKTSRLVIARLAKLNTHPIGRNIISSEPSRVVLVKCPPTTVIKVLSETKVMASWFK